MNTPLQDPPERSRVPRARFWRSFGHAWDGLVYTAKTQRNFRVELALGLAALTAGGVLRISPGEWAAVLLAIALVLTTELINTALEAVVDLASPEYHPLAKATKDAAAAAVFVAAAAALAVGGVVFVPHLLR